MTPIRETIARAIFETRFPGKWNDIALLHQQDNAYREADAVLRALDEAGCVVAPKEPSGAMLKAAVERGPANGGTVDAIHTSV